MIIGDQKPPLVEVTHFGVKGMHWGVRRAEQPLHSSYSLKMRTEDRSRHGARAVSRINAQLHKGRTRAQALEREDTRNTYQRLAVVGGLVAAQIIASHGASRVILNATRNDSTLGIAAKATKIKYITPNRHGVHKITTLK